MAVLKGDTTIGGVNILNLVNAAKAVADQAFPAAGGMITGDVRIKKNNSNYGSTLRFGDGDYVWLKEPTDDNLEVKAKNVNFVVSGNITQNGNTLFNISVSNTTPTSLADGKVMLVYA